VNKWHILQKLIEKINAKTATSDAHTLAQSLVGSVDHLALFILEFIKKSFEKGRDSVGLLARSARAIRHMEIMLLHLNNQLSKKGNSLVIGNSFCDHKFFRTLQAKANDALESLDVPHEMLSKNGMIDSFVSLLEANISASGEEKFDKICHSEPNPCMDYREKAWTDRLNIAYKNLENVLEEAKVTRPRPSTLVHLIQKDMAWIREVQKSLSKYVRSDEYELMNLERSFNKFALQLKEYVLRNRSHNLFQAVLTRELHSTLGNMTTFIERLRHPSLNHDRLVKKCERYTALHKLMQEIKDLLASPVPGVREQFKACIAVQLKEQCWIRIFEEMRLFEKYKTPEGKEFEDGANHIRSLKALFSIVSDRLSILVQDSLPLDEEILRLNKLKFQAAQLYSQFRVNDVLLQQKETVCDYGLIRKATGSEVFHPSSTSAVNLLNMHDIVDQLQDGDMDLREELLSYNRNASVVVRPILFHLHDMLSLLSSGFVKEVIFLVENEQRTNNFLRSDDEHNTLDLQKICYLDVVYHRPKQHARLVDYTDSKGETIFHPTKVEKRMRKYVSECKDVITAIAQFAHEHMRSLCSLEDFLPIQLYVGLNILEFIANIRKMMRKMVPPHEAILKSMEGAWATFLRTAAGVVNTGKDIFSIFYYFLQKPSSKVSDEKDYSERAEVIKRLNSEIVTCVHTIRRSLDKLAGLCRSHRQDEVMRRMIKSVVSIGKIVCSAVSNAVDSTERFDKGNQLTVPSESIRNLREAEKSLEYCRELLDSILEDKLVVQDLLLKSRKMLCISNRISNSSLGIFQSVYKDFCKRVILVCFTRVLEDSSGAIATSSMVSQLEIDWKWSLDEKKVSEVDSDNEIKLLRLMIPSMKKGILSIHVANNCYGYNSTAYVFGYGVRESIRKFTTSRLLLSMVGRKLILHLESILEEALDLKLQHKIIRKLEEFIRLVLNELKEIDQINRMETETNARTGNKDRSREIVDSLRQTFGETEKDALGAVNILPVVYTCFRILKVNVLLQKRASSFNKKVVHFSTSADRSVDRNRILLNVNTNAGWETSKNIDRVRDFQLLLTLGMARSIPRLHELHRKFPLVLDVESSFTAYQRLCVTVEQALEMPLSDVVGNDVVPVQSLKQLLCLDSLVLETSTERILNRLDRLGTSDFWKPIFDVLHNFEMYAKRFDNELNKIVSSREVRLRTAFKRKLGDIKSRFASFKKEVKSEWDAYQSTLKFRKKEKEKACAKRNEILSLVVDACHRFPTTSKFKSDLVKLVEFIRRTKTFHKGTWPFKKIPYVINVQVLAPTEKNAGNNINKKKKKKRKQKKEKKISISDVKLDKAGLFRGSRINSEMLGAVEFGSLETQYTSLIISPFGPTYSIKFTVNIEGQQPYRVVLSNESMEIEPDIKEYLLVKVKEKRWFPDVAQTLIHSLALQDSGSNADAKKKPQCSMSLDSITAKVKRLQSEVKATEKKLKRGPRKEPKDPDTVVFKPLKDTSKEDSEKYRKILRSSDAKEFIDGRIKKNKRLQESIELFKDSMKEFKESWMDITVNERKREEANRKNRDAIRALSHTSVTLLYVLRSCINFYQHGYETKAARHRKPEMRSGRWGRGWQPWGRKPRKTHSMAKDEIPASLIYICQEVSTLRISSKLGLLTVELARGLLDLQLLNIINSSSKASLEDRNKGIVQHIPRCLKAIKHSCLTHEANNLILVVEEVFSSVEHLRQEKFRQLYTLPQWMQHMDRFSQKPIRADTVGAKVPLEMVDIAHAASFSISDAANGELSASLKRIVMDFGHRLVASSPVELCLRIVRNTAGPLSVEIISKNESSKMFSTFPIGGFAILKHQREYVLIFRASRDTVGYFKGVFKLAFNQRALNVMVEVCIRVEELTFKVEPSKEAGVDFGVLPTYAPSIESRLIRVTNTSRSVVAIKTLLRSRCSFVSVSPTEYLDVQPGALVLFKVECKPVKSAKSIEGEVLIGCGTAQHYESETLPISGKVMEADFEVSHYGVGEEKLSSGSSIDLVHDGRWVEKRFNLHNISEAALFACIEVRERNITVVPTEIKVEPHSCGIFMVFSDNLPQNGQTSNSTADIKVGKKHFVFGIQTIHDPLNFDFNPRQLRFPMRAETILDPNTLVVASDIPLRIYNQGLQDVTVSFSSDMLVDVPERKQIISPKKEKSFEIRMRTRPYEHKGVLTFVVNGKEQNIPFECFIQGPKLKIDQACLDFSPLLADGVEREVVLQNHSNTEAQVELSIIGSEGVTAEVQTGSEFEDSASFNMPSGTNKPVTIRASADTTKAMYAPFVAQLVIRVQNQYVFRAGKMENCIHIVLLTANLRDNVSTPMGHSWDDCKIGGDTNSLNADALLHMVDVLEDAHSAKWACRVCFDWIVRMALGARIGRPEKTFKKLWPNLRKKGVRGEFQSHLKQVSKLLEKKLDRIGIRDALEGFSSAPSRLDVFLRCFRAAFEEPDLMHSYWKSCSRFSQNIPINPGAVAAHSLYSVLCFKASGVLAHALEDHKGLESSTLNIKGIHNFLRTMFNRQNNSGMKPSLYNASLAARELMQEVFPDNSRELRFIDCLCQIAKDEVTSGSESKIMKALVGIEGSTYSMLQILHQNVLAQNSKRVLQFVIGFLLQKNSPDIFNEFIDIFEGATDVFLKYLCESDPQLKLIYRDIHFFGKCSLALDVRQLSFHCLKENLKDGSVLKELLKQKLDSSGRSMCVKEVLKVQKIIEFVASQLGRRTSWRGGGVITKICQCVRRGLLARKLTETLKLLQSRPIEAIVGLPSNSPNRALHKEVVFLFTELIERTSERDHRGAAEILCRITVVLLPRGSVSFECWADSFTMTSKLLTQLIVMLQTNSADKIRAYTLAIVISQCLQSGKTPLHIEDALVKHLSDESLHSAIRVVEEACAMHELKNDNLRILANLISSEVDRVRKGALDLLTKPETKRRKRLEDGMIFVTQLVEEKDVCFSEVIKAIHEHFADQLSDQILKAFDHILTTMDTLSQTRKLRPRYDFNVLEQLWKSIQGPKKDIELQVQIIAAFLTVLHANNEVLVRLGVVLIVHLLKTISHSKPCETLWKESGSISSEFQRWERSIVTFRVPEILVQKKTFEKKIQSQESQLEPENKIGTPRTDNYKYSADEDIHEKKNIAQELKCIQKMVESVTNAIAPDRLGLASFSNEQIRQMVNGISALRKVLTSWTEKFYSFCRASRAKMLPSEDQLHFIRIGVVLCHRARIVQQYWRHFFPPNKPVLSFEYDRAIEKLSMVADEQLPPTLMQLMSILGIQRQLSAHQTVKPFVWTTKDLVGTEDIPFNEFGNVDDPKLYSERKDFVDELISVEVPVLALEGANLGDLADSSGGIMPGIMPEISKFEIEFKGETIESELDLNGEKWCSEKESSSKFDRSIYPSSSPANKSSMMPIEVSSLPAGKSDLQNISMQNDGVSGLMEEEATRMLKMSSIKLNYKSTLKQLQEANLKGLYSKTIRRSRRAIVSDIGKGINVVAKERLMNCKWTYDYLAESKLFRKCVGYVVRDCVRQRPLESQRKRIKLEFVIMVDNSGSMLHSKRQVLEGLVLLMEILQNLEARFAVYRFGKRRSQQPLKKMDEVFNRNIGQKIIEGFSYDEGSYPYTALEVLAREIWKSPKIKDEKSPGSKRIVIMITDGLTRETSPENYRTTCAQNDIDLGILHVQYKGLGFNEALKTLDKLKKIVVLEPVELDIENKENLNSFTLPLCCSNLLKKMIKRAYDSLDEAEFYETDNYKAEHFGHDGIEFSTVSSQQTSDLKDSMSICNMSELKLGTISERASIRVSEFPHAIRDSKQETSENWFPDGTLHASVEEGINSRRDQVRGKGVLQMVERWWKELEDELEPLILDLLPVLEDCVLPCNKYTRRAASLRGTSLYLPGLVKAMVSNWQYKKYFSTKSAGGKREYNISVVIDTSASMRCGTNKNESTLGFLGLLLTLARIGIDDFSVVTFGRRVRVVKTSNQQWDNESKFLLLSQLWSGDLATFDAEAIAVTTDLMLESSASGPKLAFVFTDGFTSCGASLLRQLRRARSLGVNIIAIGLESGNCFVPSCYGKWAICENARLLPKALSVIFSDENPNVNHNISSTATEGEENASGNSLNDIWRNHEDVFPDLLKRLAGERERELMVQDQGIALYTVDLCFVLDITGSMCSFIGIAKSQIVAIAKGIKKKLEEKCKQVELHIRLGAVAYRDKNDNPQFQHTQGFVENDEKGTKEFTDFITSLNPSGGGDIEEDVEAAILKAFSKDFDWKSKAKLLVLITDAPGHCNYSNPNECSKTQSAMNALISKGVDFVFCRVDPDATKMMEKTFRSLYDSKRNDRELHITDMVDAKAGATRARFHFVLCLDESSSMLGGPWKGLMQAFRSLVNSRMSNQSSGDLLSVILYKSSSRIVIKGETIASAVGKTFVMRGGGTCFDPALADASTCIASVDNTFQPVLIFMSDGGASNPETRMRELALKHRGRRLQVHTIAFGSKADVRTLQSMAENAKAHCGHGEFHKSVDAVQLSKTFASIASQCTTLQGLVDKIGGKIASAVTQKLMLDHL